MSGFVLDTGSGVVCVHGGSASPTSVSARVRIDGRPAVLQPAPWVVAACTLPPPPTANGPCVTVRWISGSVCVRCERQPLLIQSSQAVCAPTGTGVQVVGVQTRVRAR